MDEINSLYDEVRVQSAETLTMSQQISKTDKLLSSCNSEEQYEIQVVEIEEEEYQGSSPH